MSHSKIDWHGGETPGQLEERLAREMAREKRRLAGIRRRKKITGVDVGYFGQGLGAHKRPGRKRK